MLRITQLIFIFGLSFGLSSCGIIAMENARSDMMKSKENYKACLASAGAKVSECEGARLAYEADMKAYKATNDGLRGGSSDSLNVTSD